MGDAAAQRRSTRIAFSYPADPDSIGDVRHLVVSEARTLPFSNDELDDIALAVSEAFTNLIQYTPGHRVRGSCEVTPNRLEVRFEIDQNITQHLLQRQFPTGMSHSGRGIPLLNLLIPIIEVQQRPDNVWEMRLVKPVSQEKETT